MSDAPSPLYIQTTQWISWLTAPARVPAAKPAAEAVLAGEAFFEILIMGLKGDRMCDCEDGDGFNEHPSAADVQEQRDHEEEIIDTEQEALIPVAQLDHGDRERAACRTTLYRREPPRRRDIGPTAHRAPAP